MFRRNLMYAAFWPFFGLCFYALEWLVPGREYHVMYHPIDDLIPFCELFLIPYLFWFVFMGFAYVYAFFADGAAFQRMMRFTILTYAMAPYILAENPDISGVEALRLSRQMMKGHKWELFWLELTFIGWSILAAFVPLIGGAVVETYKGISKTSFYRDIQNQNRWNTVENF